MENGEVKVIFLKLILKDIQTLGITLTVIDTKNSNKIKGDHIYQVGVYCDLLKKIQGVFPEKFYILLKNNKKESNSMMYSKYFTHKKMIMKIF